MVISISLQAEGDGLESLLNGEREPGFERDVYVGSMKVLKTFVDMAILRGVVDRDDQDYTQRILGNVLNGLPADSKYREQIRDWVDKVSRPQEYLDSLRSRGSSAA